MGSHPNQEYEMIAIVGAGSMGSMFGGMLAAAGNDVALVDVDTTHVDAVSQQGLVMRDASGIQQVTHPIATTKLASLGSVSLAFVLTKSWATADATNALQSVLTEDGLVITVQNGLGNDHVLADGLGIVRVLGGTTTAGAQLVCPGIVTLSPITSQGRSITECAPIAAELLDDPGFAKRATHAANLLTEAGLPTYIRTSVREVIWKKLCLAATAAPLTAILRCTVADLLSSESSLHTLRRMFDEVIAVAYAEGVQLDAAEIWEHAITTFSNVGAHHTSMAVDVAKGRRTEIDAMSGAISKLGRLHGIATPVHEVVSMLIHSLEPNAGI